MKLLFSFLILLLLFIFSTREAKAIIVVVPTIIIPIVHIAAWIIGAVATPVLGLSALYFKIKKKSPAVGILFGMGLLVLLGIIITIVFKIISPQRPIY
ncbi:MAG: hypothetical protein UT58_C0005G0007 [Microgenomates group bacterium GW2011_GWC1_39_7b]|uniref:Uncharacterized protein n=3 Tax=Candidatus Woeseibacteriota TaxID=1752722 RepID=A0A0G0P213_9BACT|nr:MAG: hypothetical protein UT17_C0003G0142 [Candidatus Woesebacteria bacterium GW2011_GWB1_39_10]KKR26831.1 MAG: hypothetical protein UT58_C0005G0007 [Microgenomates group bacterium GW2011_GWC1_39_7b]KKR73244.1 MAG: hypothetical protein UU16_C0026G0002 [Candidatus Woesebacteria bacterium GW2011_GWA2_40_7]KKS91079.1 MAG: hypothetical protein UV66_C0001G0436 [Candidatus Woesebacteria bacterium GW2011_GWA1_43_12]